MKFNFKIQAYQTDAVDAVVKVFQGQGYHDGPSYIRDMGKQYYEQPALQMRMSNTETEDFAVDDIGFKNEEIELTDEELLQNIQLIQNESNIKQSASLVKALGRCSLDINMETGTGKTYVYIKTMFELNKHYGWSKFIVVVPSIAIREGVNKSFTDTVDHFMQYYKKKARFFIYDSKNLNQLDTFSSNSGINVMIINTQAFATSLKENGKNKVARIIYSKRDGFASRRPIDVIKANRPIIILDEPQKMGGKVTQNALKNFNPLFSLYYSATHKEKHNLIYVLDALDAFNKKLVKKIEVKGFEIKNLKGIDGYLYLEQILLSNTKPPMAKMELEVKNNKGIKREIHILNVGDDLYQTSNGMAQYKGYAVSEIEPIPDEEDTGKVSFTNGEFIYTGEVASNAENNNLEEYMRRIQIRETIISHFEKEEKLYNMGIKCLSLLFIDEVAKYRQYDENGNEILGKYGKMFEEEYTNILDEHLGLFNTPYQKYLKSTCSDVSAVHNGYFSIDRRTGKSIDSKPKRGNEFSDDISAYDLILKDKERLLSFNEPTRFIFSHSALREGWDNPNIFQICTLKHSDNQMAKRQEVGRGLRLCVDQDGNRMDLASCGEDVHKINLLTVIASESYKGFVTDLQSDIKNVLYKRPIAATSEYFINKSVRKSDGTATTIDADMANKIVHYLIRNGYTDDEDKVTSRYREDAVKHEFVELPEKLRPISDGIHTLIKAIYDDSILDKMISNGHETKIRENKLNSNFYKTEFQDLWKKINHKYVYLASFDSNELIDKAVECINDELFVPELQYTMTTGQQKDKMDEYEIENGKSFVREEINTQTVKHVGISHIKYDLIGKIAEGTKLTRKTVGIILQKLREDKLYMFQNNPEEFITQVTKKINEQKATMIVDHISYNQIVEKYTNEIFTVGKNEQSFSKAFPAKKAIQDYVFTDGTAEESIEKNFAKNLDVSSQVCVYAKLPKGFYIPTPFGNYSPDWAIAFYKGTVKHMFFIAETKGTMDSADLRHIENGKISCAEKLFNELSTKDVMYSKVDSYETLMKIVKPV